MSGYEYELTAHEPETVVLEIGEEAARACRDGLRRRLEELCRELASTGEWDVIDGDVTRIAELLKAAELLGGLAEGEE